MKKQLLLFFLFLISGIVYSQTPVTYYRDLDGDVYGNPSQTIISTTGPPMGYVAIPGDCNDTNPQINPGMVEKCDAANLDEDCDAMSDNNDPSATNKTTFYADQDLDGFGNSSFSIQNCDPSSIYTATVGGDCDDSNPNIHPGAIEYCDASNVDEDCDGVADNQDPSSVNKTTYYADNDLDGYGDPNSSILNCDPTSIFTVTIAGDCNDNNPFIHPGASEVCNGIDDDCDGNIDDNATGLVSYYLDSDNDGYGLNGSPIMACPCCPPLGYITTSGDCNDSDPNVHPSATEICNGNDDNCNSQVDEGAMVFYFLDSDNDGFGNPDYTQEYCPSSVPSNYVLDNTDCDDSNQNTHPGATEVCNGIDDDCDGTTDDNATDMIGYYADVDQDGYGNTNASPTYFCPFNVPSNYVTDNTDCDDADPNTHPGANEVCNNLDDNCDGNIDENAVDMTIYFFDADLDGYGNPNQSQLYCQTNVPSNYVLDNTDCDDTNSNINPVAIEITNGIDDNCDGNIDENVGINEHSISSLIWLYPNPSNGFFTLKSDAVFGSMEIVVSNYLGEIILTKKLTENTTTIDLSKESNGIYYMVVNFAPQRAYKLIKQ